MIIYLPEELFSDGAGEDDDSSSEDESEDEHESEKLKILPPRRNGETTSAASVGETQATDASANGEVDPQDELLRIVVRRFEPDQPDTLDRLIAMFNAGRCLGPEGEAQMRRLVVQRRRRLRRWARRALEDPDWSPTRRQMSMAECFRTLGHLLNERGSGGAPAASSPPTSDVDEGASGCSTASPATSPSPPREIRIEITEESLAELMHLSPEAESLYVRVMLSVTRSPVIHFCLEEDPESALSRRWLRHCARQSSRRQDWELRLAEAIGDVLERRLSGALYDPVWCSRLTNLLASDLLELVTHILGDEFKVVSLLSIGSVTELDSLAMETRSVQFEEMDTCKAFHYQNESVFALFTCHLFQRFDRQLEDSPLDDSEVASGDSADFASVGTSGDSTLSDGEVLGFEKRVQPD